MCVRVCVRVYTCACLHAVCLCLDGVAVRPHLTRWHLHGYIATATTNRTAMVANGGVFGLRVYPLMILRPFLPSSYIRLTTRSPLFALAVAMQVVRAPALGCLDSVAASSVTLASFHSAAAITPTLYQPSEDPYAQLKHYLPATGGGYGNGLTRLDDSDSESGSGSDAAGGADGKEATAGEAMGS